MQLGGGICNKSLHHHHQETRKQKKGKNEQFFHARILKIKIRRFIIIMKVNYIHVVALNVNLYVFTSLDVENINYKNTVYLELS